MKYIVSRYSSDNELQHHGILGQKWGVRRYQNEDGSLKPAGEKRYTKYDKKLERSKEHDKQIIAERALNRDKLENIYDKKIKKAKIKGKAKEKIESLEEEKEKQLKDFDLGTKFVKQGNERYNDIIKNFKDAKIESLRDPSFKKSDAYKKAKKAYLNQSLYSVKYGAINAEIAAKLDYAHEAAIDYYSKRD